MKQLSIILSFLLGLTGVTEAQKQNNIWYFGHKAGLDFNTIPPTSLLSDLITLEGTASISDPAGHLLFYTNGATVWDRNHNVMPNGHGLLGGESSTQAALIVPVPNSCTKYYLFTTEDHFTDGGLSYSIVDMCLNSGNGDIVVETKNTLIVDRTSEKLTAVLHSNGLDIWIITHRLSSNEFLAFLISSAGLNTTPVVSAIGSNYPPDGHIGPAKASHDGTKIVSSATFHNICEMFDFNSSTGKLSNFYNINQLFEGARWVYGIEFSPNDSLLYLSTTFVTCYLYQIDLESKQLITLNSKTGNYHYGALQLGPDKKIYMARSDSSFLDVIHQPDLGGIASQYEEAGMPLAPSTHSALGLPNFAPYSFFIDSTSILSLGADTTICIGATLTLSPEIPSTCEATFLWSTGSSDAEIEINHPGVYWVEVTSTCTSFTDSIQVSFASCQVECGSISGPIYGSAENNERGYCIVATPENDGLYVGGIKDDSLLLLKVGLNGDVQWSRTFNLIPENEEFPYSIIVDSDGMIALSGTVDESSVGGGIFVLRYDPYNHLVLWQNNYVSSPNAVPGAIIQKGASGNYVMTNDLNVFSGNHIDVELLEIDKNTGAVIPTLVKTYRLTNRESLFKIVYDGIFIYGSGRYKEDDFTDNNFRNTIVKINPDDGSQVWVKMGHIQANAIARLYGAHILIDQNEIISGSYGDPDGTSVTSTNLYLQKTDLDGNVIWLKQYLISETNAYNYGIIKSGNGYIVLAGQTLPQSEIVMFKIDSEGAVLWAKTFDYSSMIEHAVINPTIGVRGQTKIVEVGNKLFFIGYGENVSGETDMLIVRTDLDGEVNLPCVTSNNFSIEVVEIDDPVFFSVFPEEIMHSPVVTQNSPQGIETVILPRQECIIFDTIITTIEATICAGQFFEGYNVTGIFTDTFLLENGCDSIRILNLIVTPPVTTVLYKNICHNEIFEGYTISGTYADTFALANGCDSIRILHLSVFACAPFIHYDLNACRSYMVDGSDMDYSEFVPTHPEFTCAEVEADFLYRSSPQENKHSCTPGVNNTIAMCVSSYSSCTYSPGNPAAVIIDFSITPIEDSLFRFSGIQFYEKAPSTYTWIDGPSGPNNYPLKYGIRILKNGIEVFRAVEIQTSLNWTLQSFNFIDSAAFAVEGHTIFRIELLPYCPIGNGAAVSAWDLDEIRIFSACAPIEDDAVILGSVITREGHPIKDVQMLLSDHFSFDPYSSAMTAAGEYMFEEVKPGSYFLKGFKNDDVLNGVSTLDLIQIQRHLLGYNPFTSLHQFIAADANHNGSINAFDLIDIQKLLLGKTVEFPRNTSWRFGPLSQDMQGTNISAFQEIVNLNEIMNDTHFIDFVGIKIGDVNGDVVLDAQGSVMESRTVKELILMIEEKEIQPGVPFTVDIRANQNTIIAGMQFALNLQGMNLGSIIANKIPVANENYYVAEDGILRFSWNTNEALGISKNDVLFSMVLTSSHPGLLSQNISLKERALTPEAYASDLEIYQLGLNFEFPQNTISESGFFHIEPNPFQSDINIMLNIMTGGNVEINFYDVSGRRLHQINNLYKPGKHTIPIQGSQLLVNEGVIYCQVISSGYTYTKKIIKLE